MPADVLWRKSLSASQSRIRAEHIWWAGIALWIGAAIFWHPEPSVSFAHAPSASPRPGGFAVFHELVAMDAAGARRYLGRPRDIPKDIDVLVLLSPTEPVPAAHREEMLDWVSETGGTLILGHPIYDMDSGARLGSFTEGTDSFLCGLLPAAGESSVALYYVPEDPDGERETPFEATVRQGFDANGCYGSPLIVDSDEGIFATVENSGDGTVVQLAAADILDNDALGRKRSHRFAAALIQRFGASRIWAFNEAYEGIHPTPKFVQLAGASKWRPVFLQILLLMIIGYWQRSMTFARRSGPLSKRDTREVATQARDIGDFYYRAQKGRYALSRSLEYLRWQTKIPGADSTARNEALALIRKVEEALEAGEHNLERDAYLVRKMAIAGRSLLSSSKGRHHESV
jgi:hypothetical protein